MADHDDRLSDLQKLPIVTGVVKVDKTDEVEIKGKTFSLKQIKKDDFETSRKLLNGNTLKSHVQKKNKELGLTLSHRSGHMELSFDHPTHFI